jgi:hypothetical protein
MKALISPNEQAFSFDGEVLGQRVAEVAVEAFDVAESLFWVNCPEDCVRDEWYYADGAVLKKPVPPAIEAAEVIELPPQEMEF